MRYYYLPDFLQDKHAPESYRLIRAYSNGTEIIIPGDPDEEKDGENHNCDALGCGWEHVAHRFPSKEAAP
jgi:calcineurin-like phosphoesterase family protein